MARITVEDCNKYIRNRFELILVAAQRGKQLNRGAAVSMKNVSHKKEALIALREIAAGSLKLEDLEKSAVCNDFEDEVKNVNTDSSEIDQSKQLGNSVSENVAK